MNPPLTQADVLANEAANQQLRKHCERQIAALLARLESLTGCYVEGVDIHNRDATTISDRAAVHQRQVVITLMRAPGSRWET